MLGIENTALGFKAGFTGQYIDDFLRGKAIGTEFIDVPGLTRINVFTQVNDTQEEFKLVNKGPEIPEESVTQFLARVEQLQAGDFLCVSGSLPQGVAPTILIELAKRCQEREVFLIIDSSYKEELAAWFGVTIDTKEDYLHYGKKLVALGAQNVLLSLGGEGAYFFSKDALLYGNSPKGKVVNTACAGDTLLGTFLAGILKNDELSTTLKKSLAAGSSTAFRKGITDFSDVEELEKQIKISGE
jgi:1-phosphofructokinase